MFQDDGLIIDPKALCLPREKGKAAQSVSILTEASSQRPHLSHVSPSAYHPGNSRATVRMSFISSQPQTHQPTVFTNWPLRCTSTASASNSGMPTLTKTLQTIRTGISIGSPVQILSSPSFPPLHYPSHWHSMSPYQYAAVLLKNNVAKCYGCVSDSVSELALKYRQPPFYRGVKHADRWVIRRNKETQQYLLPLAVTTTCISSGKIRFSRD